MTVTSSSLRSRRTHSWPLCWLPVPATGLLLFVARLTVLVTTGDPLPALRRCLGGAGDRDHPRDGAAKPPAVVRVAHPCRRPRHLRGRRRPARTLGRRRRWKRLPRRRCHRTRTAAGDDLVVSSGSASGSWCRLFGLSCAPADDGGIARRERICRGAGHGRIDPIEEGSGTYRSPLPQHIGCCSAASLASRLRQGTESSRPRPASRTTGRRGARTR